MPPLIRRQEAALGVAAFAVLVTAVVSAGHLHHDKRARDLDHAALADIHLTLSDNLDPANGPLTLINGGPDDVTVERVQIGSTVITVGQPLESDSSLSIPVSPGSHCPATVPTAAPTTLYVSVTTIRGEERTVPVPLTGTKALASYVALQKDACGLYGVGESLTVDAARKGNGSQLLLDLHNRARGTRELLGFVAAPGFHVTGPFPLMFSAARASITNPSRQLPVHIGISDCAAAKRTMAAGVSPLVARVSDGTTTATQDLLGDSSAALTQIIARQCAGTAVGS